jgi:peptidoglycan/LPS O-acetylase OafA/YrhL
MISIKSAGDAAPRRSAVARAPCVVQWALAMGLLRTLLAIAVVLSHVGEISFIGGRNAVQIFYMISGFLMSFILVERRSYRQLGEFYISRCLRLYPQYIVIAAVTLLGFLVVDGPNADAFFATNADIGLSGKLWLIFANATLFTQDWVMLAGNHAGSIGFEPSLAAATAPLYKGLLLPQAWTLGVEMTFYLLAPFILPRRWLVITLLILSLGLRVFLFRLGLANTDPWTYRFFPTELALFLLGALAHQMLLPRYRAWRLDRHALPITLGVVGCVLVYPWVPAPELAKSGLLIGLAMVTLPALFVFQHRRTWDQWIGELSYPVYINHLVLVGAFGVLGLGANPNVHAFATIIGSVALAVVMNRYIGQPIDELRHRLRRADVPTGTTAPSDEPASEAALQSDADLTPVQR